jgi:hypothetical protein
VTDAVKDFMGYVEENSTAKQEHCYDDQANYPISRAKDGRIFPGVWTKLHGDPEQWRTAKEPAYETGKIEKRPRPATASAVERAVRGEAGRQLLHRRHHQRWSLLSAALLLRWRGDDGQWFAARAALRGRLAL